MQKFNRILLDVWSEACRDIEIEISCAKISAMLTKHIPLSQVLIRHLDPAGQTLETVAVGLPAPSRPVPAAHSRFTSEDREALMAFSARKTPILDSSDESDRKLIDRILPEPSFGDVLIGALAKEQRLLGFLVFISGETASFSEKHRQMFEVLLEPFTVTLENDLKLRELAVLREAAEADKKSLLRKLSRETMGDIIIGADSGLKQVMERAHLVARSDLPVMILGETGTGKELVAREIHRMSQRRGGPFIRINCGAIPHDLIDSQLFGHEKGSFTGAVATHKGWFERACGGTLFLDEIGELPRAGQVRLLRIIQDGWLERVGSQQSIHVDVRIVIATNRDLADMVKNGRFREDLWYRLSVFPILLPPLRNRVQDIPRLAVHFAERAAIRFSLPLQLPSENDMELLCAYPWPGNIRELGSVIERAALLGNGGGLQLSTAIGWTHNLPGRETGHDVAHPTQNKGALASLEEVIRMHIQEALEQTEGRVEGRGGAAELLGINPNTLRGKMRKLRINWKRYRSPAP